MADFYQQSAEEQAERMLDLARTAVEHWDIEAGDIALIKYRENAVFSVTDTSGHRYALRIHRSEYHSDSELLSELQWMDALLHKGVGTPPVIPSRSGSLFVIVEHPAIPEPRQVDLLGWLHGDPVGAIEEAQSRNGDEVADLFRRIGKLAAEVHSKTADWSLPEGFARHAWDAEGILGDDPFWGRFLDLAALDDQTRALLVRACDKARQDLANFGMTEQNYGLIHADFVPENLLQRGEDLLLIDFDDAGFGWHMFELATALYFHVDDPNLDLMRNAILEGYRTARALPESDWELLPLFLFLRSLTYLGWVHTRHETETARSLTPMFIDRTQMLALNYLNES
ncbi:MULTISPECIES: phosphotransferase enzyme family protein [unclassified Sphingobium]|uniref:phosphotransferase enzyme family protein n=1 Tax=unclassified Sphingobium TaxID=2611147 RepID=UPI001198D3CA|nr:MULTISPECIES: phosphotransferase [unclassified Sphingobium]MBG6120454.1 Ser/Thr protein kinase RdoA (MazF antagonist) [Sphingobium sp. JAI105]TWC98945.1 Ser/Thr protein kinase RdoA (MazF antagonist) [Sphingobium sp. AEW010]TWD18424.1 Ser/Thr protein kinase RdoA (MazF antagonist) [Sphingobium sp. AEW013]TWD21052.1 Ser/Thr protein kinase RdoA (MazF antagonist) [Sphingobium sp. AEW001]